MQYEREMMAFSDRVHTLAFAEKKGFDKGKKMVLDLMRQGRSLDEIERIIAKKAR